MTSRILPVRLPFVLPLSATKSVDRFVFAYIVLGKQIGIVDTGAAGYQQGLVDALAALGKIPSDVAWVVNTHEHPDHIGGNDFFRTQGKPQFACHAQAVRWIENLDVQYRERPIYGFEQLAGKAIRVTRVLQDGDEIDLGEVTLRVVHTPGHSPGSICLYCPTEGVLITADAIPPVGGLPLYSDLTATRQSLQRLLTLPNVRTLYCSHSEKPFTGDAIPATIQAGLDYLARVDTAVKQVVSELPTDAKPEEITRETLLRLGLEPPPVMPITVQTILSHLQS